MKFRASFCHPLQKDIIEFGVLSKEDILKKFEEIPWKEHLAKMKKVSESEVHFSPSFEIENIENRNGLSISALDNGE